jgi:hypothetical protein
MDGAGDPRGPRAHHAARAVRVPSGIGVTHPAKAGPTRVGRGVDLGWRAGPIHPDGPQVPPDDVGHGCPGGSRAFPGATYQATLAPASTCRQRLMTSTTTSGLVM